MIIGKLNIDRMINEAIYRLHDQIDGVKYCEGIQIISDGTPQSTWVLHNGIPINRIAKISIETIEPDKNLMAHVSFYMPKIDIKTQAKIKNVT